MSKNTSINDKLLSKTNIAIVCMLAMIAGFLFSRPMLSLGMMALGAAALWNVHPKKWLQQKWWLLGVLWMAMYAISFFWTDNIDDWRHRLEVKLPILLLPLAFAFIPKFSIKQLTWFTTVTALLLVGGTLYSVYPLVSHLNYYIEQYHLAHTLPTPTENDHIRFSLCIDLFFVWCAYIWPRLQTKAVKIFIAIAMTMFGLYLHLLAARTGLLLWYLFVVMWAVYIGIKRNKLLGLGILALLIAVSTLMVTYVPTLTKRVHYQFYTFERYQQGDMTGNYSDIGRLISYHIALRLIKEHPLQGVGSGDVMPEMKKGYTAWYKDVAPERQLVPHNQFLIVCLACGIPTLILFILWIFMPLFWIRKRGREGFFFFSIWISVLLPLLFEPMLEIQFGIFVYLFFLLLQKHALEHASPETDQT